MSVVYTNFAGRLVKENRGGVETEYVSDTLGSVMMCRSASGTTTYTADYWPYGEVASSTGTNPSPWGFVGTPGYYTDSVPGSSYVRARTYLPSNGRWATVDPLWPRRLPYGYCAQRPTSMVDRNGLNPVCWAPCIPCLSCATDMLIVCPPWMDNWAQCVVDVWNNLPAWTKWVCGLLCGGCIACLTPQIIPKVIKAAVGTDPVASAGRYATGYTAGCGASCLLYCSYFSLAYPFLPGAGAAYQTGAFSACMDGCLSSCFCYFRWLAQTWYQNQQVPPW